MSKLIVIVGAGALGSHLVMLLRNLDADLQVIDGDRVESRNAASQFHLKTSAGKNKTVALAGLMSFCWNRKITTVPHMLAENNASLLLGGAGLVVDCTDNLDARQLIQRTCAERKIACVHGALAADGVYGRVVWSEKFVPDAADPGVPTCEDGAFLPFISLTASYLARAIQIYVADGKKVGYEVTLTGAFKTEA